MPTARMVGAARVLVTAGQRSIIAVLDARVVAPLEEEEPQPIQDPDLVRELRLLHDLTADVDKLSRVPHAMPTAHMAVVARQLVTAGQPLIIVVPDAKVAAPLVEEEEEEPRPIQDLVHLAQGLRLLQGLAHLVRQVQELAQIQQLHETMADADKLSGVPHAMPTAHMVGAARVLVTAGQPLIIVVPDARVAAPLEEVEEEPQIQDLVHLAQGLRLLQGLAHLVRQVQELAQIQQLHETMADADKLSGVPHAMPTAHMVGAARVLVTAGQPLIIVVPDARVAAPLEEVEEEPQIQDLVHLAQGLRLLQDRVRLVQELAPIQQRHEMMADAVKLSGVPHAMPTAHMAVVARQLVIAAPRSIIVVPDAKVAVPLEEGLQRTLDLLHLLQELAQIQQRHEMMDDAVKLSRGPHVMSTAHMEDVARPLVTVAPRLIIAVPDVRVAVRVPQEEAQRIQDRVQQRLDLTDDAVKLSRGPHVMSTAHMEDVARPLVTVAPRLIIAVPDVRVAVRVPQEEPPRIQDRVQQRHEMTADAVKISQGPHVIPTASMEGVAR